MRWWMHLWGGGHTIDTDPTRKGWRAYQAGGNPDTVLVGRRGVVGCFSAVPLGGGRLDVAFYPFETPEEVLREWKDGGTMDADYRTLHDVSGWGLNAIDMLNAFIQRYAA